MFSSKNKNISHGILIKEDLKKMGVYDTFYNNYSKEDVFSWLKNPAQYQDKLINISNYLYNVSNHYRRLIKYFSSIPLLSYIVVPYDVDMTRDKFKKEYREAVSYVDGLNLKHEISKAFSVCMREDIFYGLIFRNESNGHTFIKKLPYKHCMISYVQDGCYGISFDFSYFFTRPKRLKYYGEYFIDIYNQLKRESRKNKNVSLWYKIPLEKAFALKWEESLDYALPPMVGVLPSLFDIEDYKKLKRVKEEIGNYKMLELLVPYKDGKPEIPFNVIESYYDMIAQNTPEDIGLALTPTKLEEHNFEKSGQTQTDLVEEATNNFFSNAGVSQFLFGSNKSGTSVINASTEVDSTYVYGLNRQVERYVNYLLRQKYGKQKYKIEFLDITIFNKDKILDSLTKLGTYGFGGVISKIAAINNMNLFDLENMSTLENDVFGFHNKFVPFKSSHTQTVDENKVGFPTKDEGNLTEKGVQTRERDEKGR